MSYHLPDLHDVVFWDRADDPGLVGVPGEVRDLGCVTSVNELDEREGNCIFECSFNYSSSYSQTYGTIIFVFDAIQKKSNHSPAALGGHLLRLLATAPHRFYCGKNRYKLLQHSYTSRVSTMMWLEGFAVSHLRSQTLSRRSVPLEAKMVSLWGDHWTCNSPSQSSNQIHVNSNRARYRQTHHATLWMRIIGLHYTRFQ